MKKTSQFFLALAVSIGLCTAAWAQSGGDMSPSTGNAQPQPQVPQPDQGGVNWKGVGVGAGTVAGNVVYIPAKLAYGILGGIAGGAGYVLTGGNKQVSNTIWRSSLGGDYVLTPDMIKGQQPVHFSGPTETSPVTAPAASAAPSPTSDAAPLSGNANGPSGMNNGVNDTSTAMTSPNPPSTHSIDRGAGLVPGATPPPVPENNDNAGAAPSSYTSATHSSPSNNRSSPLPNTSIE